MWLNNSPQVTTLSKRQSWNSVPRFGWLKLLCHHWWEAFSPNKQRDTFLSGIFCFLISNIFAVARIKKIIYALNCCSLERKTHFIMFNPFLTHSLRVLKHFEWGCSRHILMRRNKAWALVGLRDVWDGNGKVLRILDHNAEGDADNCKTNNLVLWDSGERTPMCWKHPWG